MNEPEARDWLQHKFGAAAVSKLAAFVAMLLAEAERQSLIARSTFPTVWARHIVDSAQLVLLAPSSGNWVDVGSGGGLPGAVVAILRDGPIVMVEPRHRRADFLSKVCDALELANAKVVQGYIQNYGDDVGGVISARAVTDLNQLFDWTRHIVSRETQFILPRGENALSDLARIEQGWQGVFHVEPSVTNSQAGILVAREVRPR